MASSNRAITALAVLSILLLAATVRCISYHGAHHDDGWQLADGDSYYHLRRVEETIKHKGRVPMFDPQLSFPDGQRVQWHGGYDLLVAGIVVATCGSMPGRTCLTDVAVVSTPLLGVVTTLLVLWLGWLVGGRWVGLGAGLLFATYPFSAGAAALGHVDHHVIEPLMVAVWFLLLVRKHPALSGVVAGLSFAFFPSALLPVVSTVAALAILRLVRANRDRDDHWRFTVTTTLVLIPVVLTGPFPDVIEPAGVSLFHLVVMAAATLAVVLSEVALRRATTRPVRAGIASYLAVGLGFLVVAWGPLSTLLRFGGAGGLWVGVVQQVPLGGNIAATVTFGILFAGVCVTTVISGLCAHRLDQALVGLTALPLAVVGTFQIRFLPMASALLAPTIVLAILGCGRWLLGKTARERLATRLLAMTVVGALGLLTLVPLWEYAVSRPTSDYGMRDGVVLLRRLGQTDPGSAPEAVLADWVWGHHILWYARRPTIASPFILSGHDPVNVSVRRVLLGRSPIELIRLMERRGARFLLVSPRFDVQRAADSIGVSPPDQLMARLLLTREHTRLHLQDQEGGTRLFRLGPQTQPQTQP